MSSGFKEPKIVVLVGAHPVIMKLEHKVCSLTLATLIGIGIWAITFDWEREVVRETDDANCFIYSAHNSSLGEMYLRFSELNSDSRNRRNWSRPTWSFKISSKEKPHLFTRCWLGSLLWEREQRWSIQGRNLWHSFFNNSNLFSCHRPKGNVSFKWQIPSNLHKSRMQTFVDQH